MQEIFSSACSSLGASFLLAELNHARTACDSLACRPALSKRRSPSCKQNSLNLFTALTTCRTLQTKTSSVPSKAVFV